MSEVKRWEPRDTIVGFDMEPQKDGSFVLSCDFDAAQSELSALREELGKAKRLLERSVTALSAIRNNPSLVRDIDDSLKLAEPATVQMVDCGECPYITDGCHGTCEKSRPAFWNKTTESGASE